MNKKEAQLLLQKYNQKQASAEEAKIIENWYVEESAKQQADPEDFDYTIIQQQMWVNIYQQTHIKTVPLWKRFAVAASIIFVVGIGLYYSQILINDNSQLTAQNDIPPGINKAVLTLADGSQINLSDANNGELAKQAGIKIVKMADGHIRYQLLAANISKETVFNTITVPRGAQQIIELPDGSRVWMNAESAITFPTTFANLNSRKVDLKGEAYFEVAKDKSHPFIVRTVPTSGGGGGQEVKVLGTHFNINAYENEEEVKTTLLEGSVMVTSNPENKSSRSIVVIKPNEQAVVNQIGLYVKPADIEQAVDWKNGDFVFKKESLVQLLSRVSRWYNVTIVFAPGVDTSQTFSGKVSRSKHISEVLKALQSTGELKFSIQGNKVTVFKK